MRLLCLLVPALVLVVAKNNTRPPGAAASTRIVWGQPASLGQFPHQARLWIDERYWCGGSLITPNKVLTAAHCTAGFKEFHVRVGGIYLNDYEHTVWATVTPWAMEHPNYVAFFAYYDVAVLFLQESAPLSRYIKVVNLPSRSEIKDTFTGRNALVSGWGRTSDGGGISLKLRWTTMTVIPNQMCHNFYSPGTIVESTLCAWDYNAGTCKGDSGGALVLRTRDGYKQIGVTSFGHKLGCEKPIPNGFVRVTAVLDWITRMADDDSQ